MVDVRSHLTLEICERNLAALAPLLNEGRGSAPEIPSGCDGPAGTLETTHTLDIGSLVPILSCGEILCMNVRDPERIKREGDKLKEVAEMGLQFFVFTYHGIHQPYYAHDPMWTLPPRPVGLFIATDIENHGPPMANATYRDLAALRENEDRELLAWFLAPEGARRACKCESTYRYSGDFWAYWGMPLGLSESERHDFVDRKWREFYEFHFVDRVPVSACRAALVPAYTKFADGTRQVSSIVADDEMLAFVRKKAPDLKVLYYPYSNADPDTAFLECSFRVARWRSEHGTFPDSVEDAL